jgi:hypothetical protein
LTCTLYQRQLGHLINLAREPGWKAYAWQRAKDLSTDQSGMFAGISQALTEAMRMEAGQDVVKESGGRFPMKPR